MAELNLNKNLNKNLNTNLPGADEEFIEPRQLPDHPDYDVYSDGRVYSRKSDIWLKQTKNKVTGYYSIGMDNKAIYVHVAVAKCYIPVPNELKGKKIEVNHIDNVKENNNYQNLEWTTHDKNIRQRSLDHAGENYMPRGAEHWHSRKIRVYYLDGTTRDYDNIRDCAEDNNISYANLRKILCGLMKQYGESHNMAGKEKILKVEYCDDKKTKHFTDEQKAKISASKSKKKN